MYPEKTVDLYWFATATTVMTTPKLKSRSSGVGPFFVGPYAIGSEIASPWEPTIGNTATLKSEEVTILATITEANNRTYKGTVLAFEDYLEEEFEGCKAGDTIEFNYNNLFGVSR